VAVQIYADDFRVDIYATALSYPMVSALIPLQEEMRYLGPLNASPSAQVLRPKALSIEDSVMFFQQDSHHLSPAMVSRTVHKCCIECVLKEAHSVRSA
jgi:hypothetical protein